MGNTHFFYCYRRIGYSLGNTQLALSKIKLYVVWCFINGVYRL
nr:MAG TPA: hypothetical protein [Caudoviricetes sp.]